MSIPIRAAGQKNAQVSDRAKELIHDYLAGHGVGQSEDTILLHHYKGGEYVAVSLRGHVDIKAFNSAYHAAVDGNEKNREINDDCFWVHRQWIEELAE